MRKYFFVLIWFLSVSIPAYADNQSLNFLVLTDIHFSPYRSCEDVKQKPCPLISKLRQTAPDNWHALLKSDDTLIPTYRHATNYVLLDSSLNAAKDAAQKEDVKFVLVLGDFLSHRFRHDYKTYSLDESRTGYAAFAEKTLKYVSHELAATFPNSDVYMVVGNNDSFHRDYYVNPNGDFFKEMAGSWSSLIKNKINRQTMRSEFSELGYYAINIPNYPSLKLIVLNTVLFSDKASGVDVEGSALKQLNWLHNELASARKNKERVIIAMHIPEAIDSYTSFFAKLMNSAELWVPEYSDKFRDELKTYAPEIAGLYAGHLHRNWMHSLQFDHADVPYVGTVSVSPIYGNDPGFRIYRYGVKDYTLEDFLSYSLPLQNGMKWVVAKNAPNEAIS